MINPLFKRVPKNIKKDWKKYLILCLLLLLTISLVSAMYVGNNSMERTFADCYADYNIEDGHFELKDEPTDFLKGKIEDEGIKLYPQFYKDFDEDKEPFGDADGTIRVFAIRKEVNLAAVKEGKMPTGNDEIAIDFRHAGNSGIKVGDSLMIGVNKMTVTGLVSFSDYSTLYKKNTDTMFDAITFDIACVTQECFEKLDADTVWQFAYQYNDRPETDEEKKILADDLIPKVAVLAATGGYLDDEDAAKELADNVDIWTAYLEDVQDKADELEERGDELQERAAKLEAEGKELKDNITELTDFVPEYACQAIHFAPNDMGSDKAMCEVLLIVFVVVLAFIFAITASNTITSEAKVIGTLRASGYTRGELLRHYVSVPIILTIISALLGNLIGYTVLKNVVIFVYSRSYSLPPIKTYWDADAFIRTTVFPVVTVVIINVVTVAIRLRISPLKFLRGDLSLRKNKKAVRLPKFKFFTRFRLRILGQNVPGYLVLFAGIFFVMVLLIFSVGMPYTLDKYMSKADTFAIADYQVILKTTEDDDGNRITTDTATAEEFSMDSLSTVSGVRIGEEITVYGYSEGSKIFDLPYDLPKGKVYISSDYADKFGIDTGDEIELKAKFAKDAYRFEVAGIHEIFGSLSIMMPNDSFNEVFGNEKGSFSGFISNKEIKDIDDKYIGAVITRFDLMAMARQLSYSMGGIMDIFSYFCAAMAILIIYLLTKIIIENNAGSISMVKVLGYKPGEIGSLYVLLTTIVVVISTAAAAALSYYFVAWLWRYIMYGMAGWFRFEMDFPPILKCVVMVLVAYTIVALIDLRRIRRIPLTEALKNVE